MDGCSDNVAENVVQDKEIKSRFSSKYVRHSIQDSKAF